MALSEREQRLLEEMERNLLQHEADVVAPGANRGLHYGSLLVGILIAVAGLGGVIAAIAFKAAWIGVVGFAVIVVGILVAMRRTVPDAPVGLDGDGPRPAGSKPQRTSFLSSFEDRWDRRNDDRDGA
ncbi:MAG TPA: DUF3040 domain-containing protein [Microbacteriaceae bacterium]|nr:DUF3040 domain-containing protein [Microbacteriaceae bacterium]